MSRKISLIFYILLIGTAIFTTLIAIFYFSQSKTAVNIKPKVAATVFPLFDFTRNIAGDNVEVIGLLPPGANPHTYEPTPQDLINLSGAKGIFMIGHGLDVWTQKLAESTEIEKGNLVITDKNIKFIETEEHETPQEDINPHYWLNVQNAVLISEQIKNQLIEWFPEYKQMFEENYTNYKSQLDDLDQDIQTQISQLSKADIATFHNAWSYFAQEYGLRIVTTFEEFPGEEPTPGYLKEFQEKIKASNINVVFAEPQFSIQTLEPIAADLNVRIAFLNPIEGGKKDDSYIKLMQNNTDTLVKELK